MVSFKSATSFTVKGIILDFCDNASTPIIGDTTCTRPAGFTVGGATPTVDVTSGSDGAGLNALGTGGGSWTAAGLNNTSGNYRTLKLTNTTGVALTAGTTYVFILNGVTNTSTLGTFYARFIDYSSTSGDIASYAPGTEGSSDATDYGGFALSTANVVTITAKVQETLTFCVSGSAPAAGCTSTSAPDVVLGHGTPAVLTPSQIDNNSTTTPTYTQISTNASNGLVVKMRDSNACGGLSTNGGTTCSIPGIGSMTTMVAGTANFGLNVADGTGGTGTVSANASYKSAVADNYAFITAGATSVTSTYGSPIESSAGPVSNVNSQLTFAATASNTTPAGIYKANLTFMANGSF